MTAGQGAESRGTPPGEASRGDGLRSKRQAVCGGRRGKRSPGGVGFVCPQRTARVSGREERGQSREGPRPSRYAAHGHNHGRATPFPGRCPRPQSWEGHALPRTLPTATIAGGPMPFPEGCSFPSQDAAHGHNRRRATPFPGRCPRPSWHHEAPTGAPKGLLSPRRR